MTHVLKISFLLTALVLFMPGSSQGAEQKPESLEHPLPSSNHQNHIPSVKEENSEESEYTVEEGAFDTNDVENTLLFLLFVFSILQECQDSYSNYHDWGK
jgi:hypothetical protein